MAHSVWHSGFYKDPATGLDLDQNEWHSVTLDDGTRIGIHFYRGTITVHPVIVDARGEETTDTSRWITYVKEEEYDGR